MKKIIAVILLFALLSSMTDARMPKKGDYVRISEFHNDVSIIYEGNITDIGNGLICLSCSNNIAMSGKYVDSVPVAYPFDVCLGTGAITSLVWLEN